MNLRDQLLAIRTRHGRLDPVLVVDAARDEAHPLHSRFEWDDSVAGEAWRRSQAQELIRSVRITYREPTEKEAGHSIRAFHAVRREDGYTYEPAEEIRQDPFARRLVLADMEREWKALYRRYQEFAEFADMVKKDVGEAA
jgi:hypothetical protein